MSRIRQLVESYGKHIAVPWRDDSAALQRVIFCIYKAEDELKIQASLGEFQLVTEKAKHEWKAFDLTDTFATWLSGQKYRASYFQKPGLISTLLPKYLDFISNNFCDFLAGARANENTVIGLTGTGSLFGLLKVKDVVDRIAPIPEIN